MPDWLSWDFWAKDSQSLNHLALIIAGAIGIPLLAVRTFAANKSAKAADAQARTAAQGHITDRFTAAVEQLGSDKMAVRLGAIYALERISRDSPRDHWTIMETLTAFVREQAPWPPRPAVTNPFIELQSNAGDETASERKSEQLATEAEPASIRLRPLTDIQALLTVLGRRDEMARKQDKAIGRRLDLTVTNLRGANLYKAHLEGASLRLAHLEGATLEEAHLEGANLDNTHLESAFLSSPFPGKEAIGLTQKQLDMALRGRPDAPAGGPHPADALAGCNNGG